MKWSLTNFNLHKIPYRLGSATFEGGILAFSFGDFLPQRGNSWTFLKADGGISFLEGLTTTFNFSKPEMGRGYRFDLSTIQNATEARLFVSAVPEPEIYAMMISGLALLGWHGRRRQRKNNTKG